MPERTYFVICEDNCKFEGMTKEQIYDAIAKATGHTPTPVDEAFITMIKEQNRNHNTKIWTGTAAQYNALETKDSDTIYFVDTNKIEPVEGFEELQEQIATIKTKTTRTEQRTLLWENASPTSGFAEQTINLDLSEYDFVEILHVSNTSGGLLFSNKIQKCKKDGEEYRLDAAAQFDAPGNIFMLNYSRYTRIYNNKITFSNGYSYSQTGEQISNLLCIPSKIYGLKEVNYE